MEGWGIKTGCKDVKIEPPLIPIESEMFQKGNNVDKVRLDVAARGVWSTFEKTFVDIIRIFNPNSELPESYKLQTLAKLLCAAREPEEKALPQQNTASREWYTLPHPPPPP